MINKEKRKVFAHILAGLIILVHGYEKLEKGESSYWIFFVLGIVFLLIALLHHRLAPKVKWIDSVFHGIEALLMFVIAYDYWHHGKTALPLAHVAAGVGYTIAAVVKGRKQAKASAVHH